MQFHCSLTSAAIIIELRLFVLCFTWDVDDDFIVSWWLAQLVLEGNIRLEDKCGKWMLMQK